MRLRRGNRPEWAPPPVRMVHLGLGAFFRAHQAVYTAHAADAADWGIAAFSGRSRDLAERLSDQDGLYTLCVRGPRVDTCEVIPNLVEAHPGADLEAWRTRLASEQIGVLTLTVTEAAYRRGPASVAPRLLDGLAARRRADAGPITIVPCDNVADNASVLWNLLVDTAERTDPGLANWIHASVRLVGTVVDRITPRTTGADAAAVEARGWVDAAPVVTEPFSEWVIGAPRGGRLDEVGLPDWVSAGAVATGDLAPYERRKLYLLNGAHSVLAYAGLLRGRVTVADAIADRWLRGLVDDLWDEAAGVVGGPVSDLTEYRSALVERFANPRMHHRLDQIAVDGATKLPQRLVPVVSSERRAGRPGAASVTGLGAWVAYVRLVGGDLVDARRAEVLTAAAGPLGDAVPRLLAVLDPALGDDGDLVVAVRHAAATMGAA